MNSLRIALIFPRTAIWLMTGTLLLVATACGDDATSPTDPGPQEVEPFLDSLPTWAEFSPLAEPSDEIAGEGEHYSENVDDTIYDCTSTPYSITENPDKIVTLDPDANILWLGALLQGKGYKEGIGSLAELPVRERAPLTISLDLLTEDNTRVIENPSLGSVNQAIGEMVENAQNAGNRPGTSVSFSQETMHSVNQAALKLGLSAGYMSVSVKASLGASRTASERTVTAYFVQKMFTVSMELPSNPMEVFSNEFTDEVLAEQRAAGRIGPDNIPVFVSSITYGRILMFSFTSTSNITDIRAALSASFSSLAGAEIEARYLDILNQAKISVVTIGGEGKNATALIQNGQLREYFNEESALTSARPISYVVRNLGDNSIAKVSETTEYDIVECAPRPKLGEIDLDVSPNDADVTISGPGGYTYNSKGDQYLRELTPGGYSIRVEMIGDDTFVPETVDVDVIAGQTADVGVVIAQEVTPGGSFLVEMKELIADELGCTWETYADLFYEIKVNGQTVASRSEGSSLERAAGVSIDLSGQQIVLDICDGQKLHISGWLADADGVGNGPDRVANFDTSYLYDNIPEGNQTIRGEASSCSARLKFRVTRQAEIACDGKTQNQVTIRHRPMPLDEGDLAQAELHWTPVSLRQQ